MKLLIDNRGLIVFIGVNIEFGIFDEPNVEKWKIDNCYAIDSGYTLVEVESIPLEVIPGKYFYIDGEFTLNPNYSNPNELEAKVTELEDLLFASDEAVVSLYEMQMAQDEINVAQDEAITDLYEIMLGGE